MNLYVKELSCIQGRLGKDRGKEKCEWGQKDHTICLVHCCLSRANLRALAMYWYFEEYNTRLNKTSLLFLRTPLWLWAAVAHRWENVFMSTSQRWSGTACKPLSLEPDPRNGADLQEKLKKKGNCNRIYVSYQLFVSYEGKTHLLKTSTHRQI